MLHRIPKKTNSLKFQSCYHKLRVNAKTRNKYLQTIQIFVHHIKIHPLNVVVQDVP